VVVEVVVVVLLARLLELAIIMEVDMVDPVAIQQV